MWCKNSPSPEREAPWFTLYGGVERGAKAAPSRQAVAHAGPANYAVMSPQSRPIATITWRHGVDSIVCHIVVLPPLSAAWRSRRCRYHPSLLTIGIVHLPLRRARTYGSQPRWQLAKEHLPLSDKGCQSAFLLPWLPSGWLAFHSLLTHWLETTVGHPHDTS
jgi:hypothetical protein